MSGRPPRLPTARDHAELDCDDLALAALALRFWEGQGVEQEHHDAALRRAADLLRRLDAFLLHVYTVYGEDGGDLGFLLATGR